MIIVAGFGILFGVIAVYLSIIALVPFTVEEQPIERNSGNDNTPACRRNVSFAVGGLTISGWLYLPEDTTAPTPCIVLNTGFCGTKDILLEKYALRFVEAGFAALSFDYRHFGDSQGEPRQNYSVSRQLEDNRAAVEYVRARSEIDAAKIFLWGTSSSGAYGILAAAEDQRIAGVIGQTPSLNHQADGKMILKREGWGWFLKLIVHAQKDKLRSRFGLSPHTFPAVGKPGSTAMLIAPGFFDGYQKIAGGSKTFRNEVCARIMLALDEPNLFKAAERVSCPVLFHLCEGDNLTSPDSHTKIERILGGKVRFATYPIGHFDIYFGEPFEESIADQISFVKGVAQTKTLTTRKAR
jgi:uncharacterized protein